jgi:hypothetical protein
MNPTWSYLLAGLGVTGLTIAASRPRIGWWVNLGAQVPWLVYAVVTRQWGFVAASVAYTAAYVRLLYKAFARQPGAEPSPARAS